MRPIFLLTVVSALLAGCASVPISHLNRQAEPGKNFIILPFLDFESQNNSGRLASELFTIHFLEKGYHVAEREKIQQIISEKELSISDLSKGSMKELEILNADYILTGAVTDYKDYAIKRQFFLIFEWMQVIYSVGVSARLIDIKTGEIMWVGVADAQSFSFKSAGEEAVAALISTMQKSH